MSVEMFALQPEKDWMIRDLELAAQADRLAHSCYLDFLVGELRQLYPDATNATEALISIAHMYDHDLTEVASVMAEVLIDSQEVPVVIRKISPIAEFDTILPDRTKRHYLIGLPESQKLTIRLPDRWDVAKASVSDLRRRANIASDIAIYFASGIKKQLGKRSPMFIAEASLSIKPFADCDERLEALAAELEQFEAQVEEAIELANSQPFKVTGPTDDEIRQSHIHAEFQRELNRLRLGTTALQQA